MKASNANKVISVLLSVAMCPMMVPSAAFAADDDAASDASSPIEQAQSADQAESVDAGASSSDTIAPQSETADASTGEAAAPAATATVNGYSTLEEAVQKATVDAQGVITYEVTGKVNVDSTGWVQVRPTAATNAKVVKFVGKSTDAEICITQGTAILADQGSSALSVEFSDLKLSKLNPTYAGDYGHSTNYFTTWLRNADAASNCVTYTNCEFPNGVCNNQYGKTVFDNCTFTNTAKGLYNMWVYGGNVEVKGGSFTGVRGVKVFTEGTATVAPKVAIEGTSFTGLTEKAAIVVSKPAAVTLSNVSATDCTKGLIQKAIDGSSEVTLDANGTGIGGSFNITANTGSDATKSEFNLNAGALTSEVSSDFLADGFTLSNNGDGTFGVAEAAPAAVAEVGGVSYPSLQAAIDAAPRKATVKLLADTKENVTISTPYVTLDLNGHTLNGSTGERKPALTVTSRAYVVDSTAAQTGTIMREDTAENSGVSSHYVIDVQDSGWLFFQGGNVKNDSGAGGTKGASLVRVGDDSKSAMPGLTISGGTFTQDNFIVLKCDHGTLYVKGGTINSANSYAIQNWKYATIKDNAVVNGNVSTWTYNDGNGSSLNIEGGTVNGNVESVTYDGAAGKPAKVAITGGTVNGELYTIDYSAGTTTDDSSQAAIEVTGGTFSTDPSPYLIESSTATQNADGTYGVAKAYLAQVGETSYYTMSEAFKAQTATGEAITLLRDYTTGSTFNSGTVARVVDLNGHTWTCTGTDANSAAFEINNPNASLTVKNGKIVSSQLIGLIPSAMGGTITYDNSTLTFENVEASTTATSGIETNGNNTNDTVVLKDSTLNVPNGFGIYFPSSGKLTIDNSKINAKTMGAQVCSGNLNVTAGSAITVSGDPVAKTESDGAIQDGAAISIVNRAGYKGLGKIAITGGTFTAKGDNAAIKAYTWDSSTKQESAFDNSAKTVAVSGGTFSAAVASDLCAEGYAPVANTDGTYSVGVPVAQIGTKTYVTLADAVAAAEDGQTVTLLGDVEQNSQLTIDKSITLDLNDKTIKNTVDIWSDDANAILSIKNGAKVTITGNGTIDAKENDCYTINMVDGDLTIENGTFYGNVSVVQVQEGILSVKGGTFDLHQKWEGSSKYLINCIDDAYVDDSANVAISGGTFVGFDPNVSPEKKVDGKAPSFAAPGVGITKNDDGSFTAATGMTSQILDKDGNSVKAYASLQAGIDAAQDGETVTLLTDATEDVAISKSITLDLGGKTLTNTNAGKATISVQGGTVTVKNGNVVGGTGYYNIEVTKGSNANLTLADVTATAGNTGSSMIDNWGTLTIESGSYSGGLDVVKSEEDSTLNINGGKFELSYATNGYTGVVFAYGNTTITGGEFIQSLTTTGRWNHPQVIATGVVEGHTAITRVTGGHFVNKMSGEGIFRGVGKGTSDNFEVSGGTFNKGISEGFCADGFIPTKNADGTYGVKEGHYVAQIGSKKYETLADAIHWATKGKTITLLTDVEQNSQLTIDKSITLDLSGKTIKNTQDIWGDNTNAILSITNGAKVTITGDGTIDAKENDCYTINVVKGDLTIENGTFYGNVSVVQVQEGTLSVKGGTFDLHQKWEGSSKYLFNCIDDAYASGSANVAISGGTFVGFDPSASPEGKGTSYLAPGYAPTANADGTYGVVAGVAQIGTKAYVTLADAVAAAKDGDTITLLSDCSGNGIVVKGDTFPNGLTIDFAGYSYTVGGKLVGSTGTASNGFQLLKGNTIVMRNGSIFGDASVAGDDTTKWSGAPAIMIQNYSNLTLDGMTVKGGKQTCYTLSNNNGDTVIKDSTIIAGQNTQVGGPFAFDVCRYASYPSVSVTVEGNSVIDGCVDVSGNIGEGQSRQLTITGGTFSKPISVSTQPANIAISGGTFATEVPADHCAAGYVPVANTDGTYGVKLPEGAYALQDYRTGDQTSWTYPTQDGKAFAGWYKDAAFTTPCTASDVEGAAYAKFVNITDLLKYKGRSLRMDKGDPSETTYLRFGYTKAIPNGATYIENGWYYKRLSAPTGDDIRFAAYNNALNDDGTITSNLVFNNVKARLYTANFIEKAFVKYVTIDGTTVEAVEGAYHSSSVSEAADAILAHPMASKAEKDYATSIKSAIKSAIQ